MTIQFRSSILPDTSSRGTVLSSQSPQHVPALRRTPQLSDNRCSRMPMCSVLATQSPGQSDPPVNNVKPRAPARAAFRTDDMLLASRLFTSDKLGNGARNGGTCFLLLCDACVELLNALCDLSDGCRIRDSRQLCCLQTCPILALSWTLYITQGGLTQCTSVSV